MSLKLVAMAIRELSYADMESLGCALRSAVQNRKEEDDLDWDDENYQHWMDLLHGWAEGELAG